MDKSSVVFVPRRSCIIFILLSLLPTWKFSHAQIHSGSTALSMPLSYDVVSVKVNVSNSESMSLRNLPDGLIATNINLQLLLMNAFDTQPELLQNTPNWADKIRFDIVAKLDQPPSGAVGKAQRQAWLRSLLQQRFALKTHQDTKLLPVFDLVITNPAILTKDSADIEASRSGRKLTDVDTSMSVGHGELNAKAVKIDNLLATLQGELGRKVINKTGLTGRYDIHLKWLPESEIAEAPELHPENDVTLAKALEEQLGLKLVPGKAPVEVVVVDHVERPQPN